MLINTEKKRKKEPEVEVLFDLLSGDSDDLLEALELNFQRHVADTFAYCAGTSDVNMIASGLYAMSKIYDATTAGSEWMFDTEFEDDANFKIPVLPIFSLIHKFPTLPSIEAATDRNVVDPVIPQLCKLVAGDMQKHPNYMQEILSDDSPMMKESKLILTRLLRDRGTGAMQPSGPEMWDDWLTQQVMSGSKTDRESTFWK